MKPRKLNLFNQSAFLWLILIWCCSCRPDFYHGYVYDADTMQPLPGVSVRENSVSHIQFSNTDEKGYFKIENHTNSHQNLIFSAKGYRVDTMLTIWSQHGETISYSFINIKPDTIFLRKKIK